MIAFIALRGADAQTQVRIIFAIALMAEILSPFLVTCVDFVGVANSINYTNNHDEFQFDSNDHSNNYDESVSDNISHTLSYTDTISNVYHESDTNPKCNGLALRM
jgi:hypothetical protein